MIAGRLCECLKILRWNVADVTEELGYPESEVATWLDGRAHPPLAVAAWLEALVKAYMALPRPSQNATALLQPEEQESGVPEIRLPAPIAARPVGKGSPALPSHRRQAVFANNPDVRHVAAATPANGGSSHESHAL
jgi:hypothetical protein